MPSVAESLAGQATPLQAALDAGIDTLSKNQVVTFTKYVRLVLPIDGYVFWVRADKVGASALADASAANAFALNQPPRVVTPATVINVQGSLHHATDNRQEVEANYSVNHMVFTAEIEVQDLNQVGPATLFMATVGGIPYAFSQRGRFYEQAKVWHYVGDAVYPELASQIVGENFDATNYVVSNSLPLWLALNSYVMPYTAPPVYPSIVLFPAMLVPHNLAPPYGIVDVEESESLVTAATLDPQANQIQLVRDLVTVTLYGLRNFQAEDWLTAVLRYSLDTDAIGIMNMPVVKDAKRGQVELGALAMKKTVQFEISYYQNRANQAARQLIEQAIVTYLPQPLIAPSYHVVPLPGPL